jgi:hypothetical protein
MPGSAGAITWTRSSLRVCRREDLANTTHEIVDEFIEQFLTDVSIANKAFERKRP